ncbi:MAG: sporulation membrane protein YtaF [Oscillospiraceae bacterium]|nr:sporulation membrane protein YtaF [Oscillospiraceae bacterium]
MDMFQIMLVIALCLDAFAASFSYGVNKTKIPALSIAVISAVCTAALALSTGIGTAVQQFISGEITKIICFALLFSIGLIKSLEYFVKQHILTRQNRKRHYRIKLFDVNFVLSVYADNMKADADHSKMLSSKEAVYLALALSLDGFAAGFGCGLASIPYLDLIMLSLLSNLLAVSLGYRSGKLLTKVTSMDFSWIGGVILMILAFTKLK